MRIKLDLTSRSPPRPSTEALTARCQTSEPTEPAELNHLVLRACFVPGNLCPQGHCAVPTGGMICHPPPPAPVLRGSFQKCSGQEFGLSRESWPLCHLQTPHRAQDGWREAEDCPQLGEGLLGQPQAEHLEGHQQEGSSCLLPAGVMVQGVFPKGQGFDFLKNYYILILDRLFLTQRGISI